VLIEDLFAFISHEHKQVVIQFLIVRFIYRLSYVS